MKIDQKYLEVIRFIITGVVSTLTTYAVYWVLLPFLNHSIAFLVGYIVAVIVNYIMTTSFTFKVKATKKNGLGFIMTNIINFILSEAFLNLFIYIGVSKQWAPIPMYAICIPINFLIVRYVMKKL
jgi:putative flippase GtrA